MHQRPRSTIPADEPDVVETLVCKVSTGQVKLLGHLRKLEREAPCVPLTSRAKPQMVYMPQKQLDQSEGIPTLDVPPQRKTTTSLVRIIPKCERPISQLSNDLGRRNHRQTTNNESTQKNFSVRPTPKKVVRQEQETDWRAAPLKQRMPTTGPPMTKMESMGIGFVKVVYVSPQKSHTVNAAGLLRAKGTLGRPEKHLCFSKNATLYPAKSLED